MKFCGTSNSLCACITRLIINHAPIDEYRLKFFSKESIAYPHSKNPIETRRHILYECSWYSKSWNPKRESLKDVLTFLEFNPRAFCFQDGIMWGGASSCKLVLSVFSFSHIFLSFFIFFLFSSYFFLFKYHGPPPHPV